MSTPGGINLALLASAAGGGGAPPVVEKSIRFNTGDSAYLNRTPSSASNRRTWTWSGWLKRSSVNLSASNTEKAVFGVNSTDNDGHVLCWFTEPDTLYFGVGYLTSYKIITSRVFRDTSAWMHLVIAFDTTQNLSSDRVKMYINGTEVTDFGTDERSSISQNSEWGINTTNPHIIGRNPTSAVRYFDGYLADVNFVDGFSFGPGYFAETDATTGQWVPKEFATGGNTVNDGTTWSSSLTNISANAGQAFNGSTGDYATGTTDATVVFNPADISFVSTVEVYINYTGTVEMTGSGSTGSLTTSGAGWVTVGSGGGVLEQISFAPGSGIGVWLYAVRVDGVIMIDSTTTTIGYGTNGYHLLFDDNSSASALGTDSSGNSNNWTTNNFSVTPGVGNDSLFDSPSLGTQTDTGAGGEVSGNYCTLNPLDKNSSATLTNGSLDYDAASGAWRPVRATIGMSSGKWYWETLVGPTAGILGIATQATSLADDYYPGIDATSYGYFNTGVTYNNGSSSSYGSSYTSGDLIGVAFDADNGKIWFSKNGTWQASGDPAAGTNAAYTGIDTSLTYFAMLAFNGAGTSSLNWGQRAWTYSAPSGFKALCAPSLTDPTITDPSAYMDAKLYTGNASTNTISGLGFSPDLVWCKSRGSGQSHAWFDQVRGSGIRLQSNSTSAEDTYTTYFTGFTSDGFTLANNSGINQSSDPLVAWCWDAGTFTASNTDGSITSSVRANQSAGFSIVSFNAGSSGNKTVGHGLNADLGMFILKDRDNAGAWQVWHKGLSNSAQSYLQFDTGASANDSRIWANTAPTNSVFSFEANYTVSNNVIGYCWAPVAGYSAFGSFVGGGTTPVFVYTGFRPRFILVKNASSGGTYDYWLLKDTARDTYNASINTLAADLPDQENNSSTIGTNQYYDFVSNGFVNRTTGAFNTSGNTFIWAAFAEHPFKYANAR